MANIFLVHGSFGNSNEHYLSWLKKELAKVFNVIALDYPIGKDNQNYENWAETLDKYKHYINEETIFIGRSIAPIFIIKYLQSNNLKIKTLISISGFNGFINIPDYDYVNKSFFLDEVKDIENFIKNRICFYSKNDPYVPFYLLDMFTQNLNAEKILIEDGGHFNEDSGYGEKFTQILKFIN